jgi:CHRD domain
MITKTFANRTIGIWALLSLVVILLLAACGGSTSSAPTSTPAATSTTNSTTATLKHVPHGTADLSWDPSSHTLTVKLSLVGLAPKSIHPAHIHTGSCSNQGAVVHPLQNVGADDHGMATVTSTVPNVMQGIPASGWYVNVHNGPGLSMADQFLPIVCGDVSNSSTSTTAAQSLHVMLTAAPSASTGQSAQGRAQLTLSGRTLTVKLTISGLAPNSVHPAHIHAGSCESQGAVVYPLTNVTADASGNATVTTTIPNVSSIPGSGWYVNVHRGPGLSTQTEFDPIACGNVTVG